MKRVCIQLNHRIPSKFIKGLRFESQNFLKRKRKKILYSNRIRISNKNGQTKLLSVVFMLEKNDLSSLILIFLLKKHLIVTREMQFWYITTLSVFLEQKFQLGP